MNAPPEILEENAAIRANPATSLALRLAHAENALQALTSGQVDATVDPTGKTYLLISEQEHLRRRQREPEPIDESLADVITIVDREGIILSQSRAVCRVLGYGRMELVGKVIFELIHEDDLPAVYSGFFNVRGEFIESAMVPFRHLTRDGSFRMIEATLAKLRDVSGGVVFSLRPVARPLRPANTEPIDTGVTLIRDRFLAILSHELRTPLMPVLLGVSELEEDERFAEARPTLAMLRRNLKLQCQILDEFHDFVALGQQKLRINLQSMDVHEAIRTALEVCRSEVSAARVTVLLDFRASDTMVRADSVKLQQVLWNLLKNAVKFSTAGTEISITSANEIPGTVTIEIVDHGLGIEPEYLPLIFDPFHQGSQTTQPHYGGLGLGLFVARGLTEAQQGTLTAASEGRGKGATFRLTLNIAIPAASTS